MTTESILYKLYSELQLEAYDEETHSYDYKRTNQIIRANIEAIPELLKLNKSDVISSVCDCAVPSPDTDKFCCTVCDKELTEDD